MKNFVLTQVGLMVGGVLLLFWAVSWDVAQSFGIGALFSCVNSGLSGWLWGRVFQKKLIAITVTIIIFKYAILGVILYKILQSDVLHPLWFAAGLSNLVWAAPLSTLFANEKTEATES